jgi:enamine deaminase RidA (YjgF/YER057c/UK114 family)
VPVTDYLKPDTLHRPRGLAQVTISQGARAIHTSGQVAVDKEGVPQHPGDHRKQAELALRNVVRAIEGAGASMADVAKIGVYIAEYDAHTHERTFEGFADAVTDLGFRVPAMVVLGVAALAAPGALVEIDAVAYV